MGGTDQPPPPGEVYSVGMGVGVGVAAASSSELKAEPQLQEAKLKPSSTSAAPSTRVGNWILTGHSFAPKREHFMHYCSALSQRRVIDHLMWFRFPTRRPLRKTMVPVHYSRLLWIGGPLAALTIPPPPPPPPPAPAPAPKESMDVDVDVDEKSMANGETEKDKETNEDEDEEIKDGENEKERSAPTADPSATDMSDDKMESPAKNDDDKQDGMNDKEDTEDKSKENNDDKAKEGDETKTGTDEDKDNNEKQADKQGAGKEKESSKESSAMDVDTEKKSDKKKSVQVDGGVCKNQVIIKAGNGNGNEEDEDEDEEEPYVRKDPVMLTTNDTPRTFAMVVKFLYCEEICFNYLTFDEIVTLATAAHRWALIDLYHATFTYVMDQNLLAGGYGIRTFIPLVNQPETPESFRRYFCIAVGHHFDILYPRLKAQDIAEPSLHRQDDNKSSKSNKVCKPKRPLLWDVVIKQRMLAHVIHCIRLYSKKSYDEYLLDVILRHFESESSNEVGQDVDLRKPMDIEEMKKSMQDDDEIVGMMWQLNWDHIDTSLIFQRSGACRRWSTRAVRLAALASCAPHCLSLQVHIPWNIPLQKLLRQDTWSFQTEHVFCGPYICYLHVRKNTGPEVSLFVHIWNRDGKQIGDEARHASVRVTCRATENNCKCNSRKQWSDCTHGFLENLKFEGKLSKYPGLGWSHFLEAKRLEEWKNSHDEDCGISICTILQFVNVKKPFEGPAKRMSTGTTNRSSFATSAMSSPIQKKRSSASSMKMKLRESR